MGVRQTGTCARSCLTVMEERPIRSAGLSVALLYILLCIALRLPVSSHIMCAALHARTPWLFSHPITTSLTHTKPTVQYRQCASHNIEK